MALWAPALVAGVCAALTLRFTASRFPVDVRAHGATFFTYIGKAVGYLPVTPAADDPLFRGFGTEAAPGDRTELGRRFACRLIEGFGFSEAGALIVPSPRRAARRTGPSHGSVSSTPAPWSSARPPCSTDTVASWMPSSHVLAVPDPRSGDQVMAAPRGRAGDGVR